MARTRTVAGAGTLGIAALVLIGGSQPITEWVNKHTSADTAWGWFLRVLTWPHWAFGPDDNTNSAMRRLLAADLRALLLILFVALIVAFAAKSVTGGGGAFLLGWAAVIFGSALAAFITAFILSSPSLLTAFQLAAAGSTYGLFAGWIVGAITATGKAAG
ncbi:hypothetical protein [Hamadaea tsunoensis]|uniref:hypothetical protein n=1 Tax=Hamadaea tsunoensis TaxID=53368 RepID=UPI0004856352|nr:hypothetical protein [Hamadaea tsunoensis]